MKNIVNNFCPLTFCHGFVKTMAITIYRPCRCVHDFENWRQDMISLQMVKIFIVYQWAFG